MHFVSLFLSLSLCIYTSIYLSMYLSVFSQLARIHTLTIEPMLDSVAVYTNETMALFLSPILIILTIIFNQETQIPQGYGIKQSDLKYYLLFSIIIINAQLAMDIFILNTLELLHTWPLFEYFEFARFRFKNRQRRWKANEKHLDETLDVFSQSLDLMCFSSQYYFMNSVHSYGIMLNFLGIIIMLRQGYNMFADPVLPVIIGFVCLTGVTITKVSVYLGMRTSLWLNKGGKGKAPIQLPNLVTGIAGPQRGELNPLAFQQLGLTVEVLRSEVVRQKFVNRNAPWLLSQLGHLLSPRSLRRYRPYLLEQHKILQAHYRQGHYSLSSDSSDEKELYREVQMTIPAMVIARFWLTKARRRRKLRLQITASVNAQRKRRCMECRSQDNLKLEQLIPFDDLMNQFDEDMYTENIDLGENFWTLRPADQWRTYFIAVQKFRTRCRACIRRQKTSTLQVSDDSGDEQKRFKTVRFSIKSREAALLWLAAARRHRGGIHIPQLRLPGAQGPLELAPSVRHDISSDDSGDDIEISSDSPASQRGPRVMISSDSQSNSDSNAAVQNNPFSVAETAFLKQWLGAARVQILKMQRRRARNRKRMQRRAIRANISSDSDS